MAEQKIGVVIHYFNHIHVAGIRLTDGELRVGDTIRVKGHTSDYTQTVESMQVDNQAVEGATPGVFARAWPIGVTALWIAVLLTAYVLIYYF